MTGRQAGRQTDRHAIGIIGCGKMARKACYLSPAETGVQNMDPLMFAH